MLVEPVTEKRARYARKPKHIEVVQKLLLKEHPRGTCTFSQLTKAFRLLLPSELNGENGAEECVLALIDDGIIEFVPGRELLVFDESRRRIEREATIFSLQVRLLGLAARVERLNASAPKVNL